MDSQWLVTKKILADLIWPVRMSQQFASSARWLEANFQGSWRFHLLATAAPEGALTKQQGCFLWLRVLRKEDISESALALLRYLLPPWLLASHRWRRQESPQEWQQMRKGFNHRKVALMHYLLLRPIEHCITGLPWNTSGCEIIKTLGCDSKNTFADDVLDTPRMFLNLHLWRFPTCFSRSVTCMSPLGCLFWGRLPRSLCTMRPVRNGSRLPDSRVPRLRRMVFAEWDLYTKLPAQHSSNAVWLMETIKNFINICEVSFVTDEILRKKSKDASQKITHVSLLSPQDTHSEGSFSSFKAVTKSSPFANQGSSSFNSPAINKSWAGSERLRRNR